ncbi:MULTISPECIES: hypothetical protein [unclassified Burkholderia]|uniref:hypothetical protein n=1 Tax=unclassified Burkholderia TaxID=2613784 RepID=UPI001FC85140|nr:MULTISPECIES: hypothetical protein [unclassified Burkholderia]
MAGLDDECRARYRWVDYSGSKVSAPVLIATECTHHAMRPRRGGALNKAKLAMAMHGKRKHYAMRDIMRRHFTAMAEYCLLGDIATPIVERLVAMTPHAIESVGSGRPVSGEDRRTHPGRIALRRAATDRNAAGVTRSRSAAGR